jgi:hypothetical protein
MGEDHEHLLETPIRYIFRSRHDEKAARTRMAEVRRVTGLTAYLAQAHEIEATGGPRPFELSHISPTGLVGHDVEEFTAIVAKHGAWMPDLADFFKASAETPLFEPGS